MKSALFLLVVFVSNVIQTITGFAGTMLAMPASILLIGIEPAKAALNPQNEKEQINLSFASRKLPDVYTHISKNDAIKYGEQGALIDLLPLIKEHAPNIMVALAQDPTWLDKLGLEVPYTPDELYMVLKAFKDHATELTDEVIIPYSSYFSGGMEGWFNIEIIKAWDWFYSDESKTVLHLGTEGDIYTIVDGKPEYTDKIMKGPNLKCARIYDFERSQLDPVLAKYKQQMMDPGALDGVKSYELARLPITSAVIKEYFVIETDLNTYLDESVSKFIRGEWNLEADYDAFAQTLKNMRAEEYLSILNEAYQKMLTL